MKFSELQSLMASRGISTMADIARELNTTPQAVSNWKARGEVPSKVVLEIQQKYNLKDKEQLSQGPAAGLPPYPSPYLYPYYPEEDTISLAEIIKILSKNLKTLIITPTITCIMAIIYVFFIAEPVYVSTAKVLPTGSGSASMSELRGLASQFGFNLPGGGKSVSIASSDMYPVILKSKTLAKNLLYKKFDTEKYGTQKTLLQILTYGDDEPEVGLDTLVQTAVKNLSENIISIDKDSQTPVVTLKIATFEPKLSASLAQAIIDESSKIQHRFKTKQILEKKTFIEGRIHDVQEELKLSEQKLKEFREQNRQIGNSPTLLLQQERLIRDKDVLKSVYTTLRQQYEIVKIDEVEKSAMVQILEAPEAPIYRNKPKRKLSIILAGLIGLGLGIGIILGKEYIVSINEEN